MTDKLAQSSISTRYSDRWPWARLARPARWLRVGACALVGLSACLGAEQAGDDMLPHFAGAPLSVGALLCITGPSSAKAPDLEPAAILAEEFINGSGRLYPKESVDSIACRVSGTCGVWVGRDVDGQGIRGPLSVVTADADDDSDRVMRAMRRLRDDYGAVAHVGACTVGGLEAAFEVSGSDTAFVTPVVTADSVSDLSDHGAVVRTVAPDYIQTQVLGLMGRNRLDPKPLVRFEDETTTTCAESADCAALGASFECRSSSRSSDPERVITLVTDVSCDGQPAGFCDQLGRAYSCVDASDGSSGRMCAQFRLQRFCTRVVQPRTAMVLYEDSVDGRAQRANVVDYWVNREGGVVLSAVPFAPTAPGLFASRVRALFEEASEEMAARIDLGELPPDYSFGDSVVFLFADATEATLLLQEWSSQVHTMGIDGADQVFWLGNNSLRSRLLADQLHFDTIRNLYVTGPSVLDGNNETFFVELFRERWGHQPGDFAGNMFDAVLLLALANEQAGADRSSEAPGGAMGANSPIEIMRAVGKVASGCTRTSISDRCDVILGTVPEAVQAPNYHVAVDNVGAGRATRLHGVTGNLELSPAGDRLSEIKVWKVEPRGGGKGQFFLLTTFTPQASGISLVR